MHVAKQTIFEVLSALKAYRVRPDGAISTGPLPVEPVRNVGVAAGGFDAGVLAGDLDAAAWEHAAPTRAKPMDTVTRTRCSLGRQRERRTGRRICIWSSTKGESPAFTAGRRILPFATAQPVAALRAP